MAIKLTADQVFPPNGEAILVSTRPNTIYDDQDKPTDRTDGIRCDVRALPDLAPVTVKVFGTQPPLSNDEIERLALNGKLTWIKFDGFSGSQYVDRRSGQLRTTATATGVHIVVGPMGDDILEID